MRLMIPWNLCLKGRSFERNACGRLAFVIVVNVIPAGLPAPDTATFLLASRASGTSCHDTVLVVLGRVNGFADIAVDCRWQ